MKPVTEISPLSDSSPISTLKFCDSNCQVIISSPSPFKTVFIEHLLCDQPDQENKLITVSLIWFQIRLEKTVGIYKTARTSTKKLIIRCKIV